MQWSQIKTLFILCFLVLDCYLLYQFVEKQKNTDVDVKESQELTFEKTLETENIDVVEYELEDEKLEEPYINIGPKIFKEADLKVLSTNVHQEITVIDNNFVVPRFNKPVQIQNDAKRDDIVNLVKSQIKSFTDYVFWEWNKELNVLVFFQIKNEQPVYFNQNGMLLVFLNEDDEMIYYTQTMFGDVEESSGGKQPLIKPMNAIETLYNKNELFYGDKVTKIEKGYHTRIRIPLANGMQVFAPTWKITVNDERNYFINAIEGLIFSSDDVTFLDNSIVTIMDKVRTMSEKNNMKLDFLRMLNEKLEAINRSEIE